MKYLGHPIQMSRGNLVVNSRADGRFSGCHELEDRQYCGQGLTRVLASMRDMPSEMLTAMEILLDQYISIATIADLQSKYFYVIVLPSAINTITCAFGNLESFSISRPHVSPPTTR